MGHNYINFASIAICNLMSCNDFFFLSFYNLTSRRELFVENNPW